MGEILFAIVALAAIIWIAGWALYLAQRLIQGVIKLVGVIAWPPRAGEKEMSERAEHSLPESALPIPEVGEAASDTHTPTGTSSVVVQQLKPLLTADDVRRLQVPTFIRRGIKLGFSSPAVAPKLSESDKELVSELQSALGE